MRGFQKENFIPEGSGAAFLQRKIPSGKIAGGWFRLFGLGVFRG
jgi:hypothetical protein